MVNTLTEKQIEAGKELIKEADALKIKTMAALWFYFQDQEAWKLMLSIKGVENDGPKLTYSKLQKVIAKAKIKDQLALSEIVLAKPVSPLLELLKTAVKTGPGISGVRFTGNVINGHLIQDAYIYRLI